MRVYTRFAHVHIPQGDLETAFELREADVLVMQLRGKSELSKLLVTRRHNVESPMCGGCHGPLGLLELRSSKETYVLHFESKTSLGDQTTMHIADCYETTRLLQR